MSLIRHPLAIAAVCVLLFAGGLPLVHAAVPPVPSASQVRWVRTSIGWQVAHWDRVRWQPPQLHPLLVATLMILASTTALVALPERRGPTGQDQDQTPAS